MCIGTIQACTTPCSLLPFKLYATKLHPYPGCEWSSSILTLPNTVDVQGLMQPTADFDTTNNLTGTAGNDIVVDLTWWVVFDKPSFLRIWTEAVPATKYLSTSSTTAHFSKPKPSNQSKSAPPSSRPTYLVGRSRSWAEATEFQCQSYEWSKWLDA